MGDRDLCVKSVGDRDLYVKKNNYMMADGAGRPTEGGRSPVQRVTGYRVMGCSVVLLWRAETGVVTSAAPIHPSIRGCCCVAS